MAKRTQKSKYTYAEAVEECQRPIESDEELAELSEAESDVSSVDSIAEEMFIRGQDAILDRPESDPDWEPEFEVLIETDDFCGEQPEEEEPQPGPSHAKIPRLEPQIQRGRGRARSRGRGRGRGKGRRPGASASQTVESTSERKWCGVEDPDITPMQPTFRPLRNQGCQLLTTVQYSPLELFLQFLTNAALLTIVNNTNQRGRVQHTPTHPWTDMTLADMFSFLSIVIYMGLIKAPALTDYWKKGPLHNFSFPKKVISGARFLAISRALHLNSEEEDTANEVKRGTAEYDRLGKIRPLYNDIKETCRTHYQPKQHISIDERMVASKARVVFKQYIKSKPVKWGFMLFVLADSETGYTWDFFVYEGKDAASSGKGLSYDAVTKLVDTNLLGTGYKLYVDNFYTSPTLFRDLLKERIWACGTVRPNRVGYPKTKNNAMEPKAPRGTIRWIRDDPLVFVQWRDTRDVFLCSTLHTAHGPDTVRRRIKDKEGRWTTKDVPIPPVVKDYNKHMGGVDHSDQLISYYDVLHKTKKWYKTFFYHFVDIGVVNAFILHKCLASERGEKAKTQKEFREALIHELSEAGSKRKPRQEQGQVDVGERVGHHRLAFVSESGNKTAGRLRCHKCHTKTPYKCSTCDIALCFMPSRNCYDDWHVENNM